MLYPVFYVTFSLNRNGTHSKGLNRMFGLSGGHLLIIAVIVLLFGNRKLPELGSALGKGINAFKKGLEGKSDEIDKKDDHQRLT